MSESGNSAISNAPNEPLERQPGAHARIQEPELAEYTGLSCDQFSDEQFFNTLTELSTDVCLYGCFVSLLIQKSIFDYDEIYNNINELGQAGITLINTMGDRLDDATASYMTDLWGSILEMGQGVVSDFTEATSSMSFSDAALSFVKGLLSRYTGPILAAAAQELVDATRQDLKNRKLLLGLISDDIDEIVQYILTISGYDWWDALKDVINQASHNVRTAKRSIGRAQANSGTGRWPRDQINLAETNLYAAWYLLSSPEARATARFESGEEAEAPDWAPFTGIRVSQEWDKISEAMSLLKKKIDTIKERYNCLVKTTVRLRQYRQLLIGVYQLVQKSQDLIDPSSLITFDISAYERALQYLYARLGQIYDSMRQVVDEDRRYTAPLLVEEWRGELWGYLVLLQGLGSTAGAELDWGEVFEPNTSVPLPFSMETYSIPENALEDLETIMLRHDPPSEGHLISSSEGDEYLFDFSITDVMSMMDSFINLALNAGELIFNKDQWVERSENLVSDINDVRRKDSKAINLLDKYQGYSYDKYDFLKNFLDETGMGSALKNLLFGRVDQIMQSDFLNACSSTLACLGVYMDNPSLDLAWFGETSQTTIQDELDKASADANTIKRSSIALPAYQFRMIKILDESLNEIKNKLNVLNDIASEVC